MDTTKLVVGQDVYVVSCDGKFFCQGKVTEIMPEGVEVLTAPYALDASSLAEANYDVDQLSWVVPMRFDTEGKNGTDGRDGQDVMEFGPWHIDDVPFAERKAYWQKRRAMIAALVVNQDVCVVGRYYYCFCWGTVVEQNGPKGVEVMIEGGACSFDEYGIDRHVDKKDGPWYIEETQKALNKFHRTDSNK